MAFDSRGRFCGNLGIESPTSKGVFKKHYFVLDKEDGKLKIYYDSPDNSPKTLTWSPCREIRLNFISMVADARKSRPKAGFVFSLTEAGTLCFIQADEENVMLRWIGELNEACRITVRTEQRVMAPGATKTEIVGGIPITMPQDNSDSGEESMEHNLPALSLPCIMSGYAIKQGAVRKNWKKRFFVLDTNGFSYYKDDQDKEPIKTLPLEEIIEAKLVQGLHHAHREHLLEVVTASRTFNIQCDTKAESVNWTKQLNTYAGGTFNTPTEVSNPTELRRYSGEEIKPSKAVWVYMYNHSMPELLSTEDPKQRRDRSSDASARSSKKSWLLWWW